MGPYRVVRAVLPMILTGCLFAAVAPNVGAITYGEPDCDNNAANLGCRHPNVVSVTGFRAPLPDEAVEGVAVGRCSGSLLSKDDERIVILTAGHCAAFYLDGLQSGALIDVGVSFDAEISRDIPEIPTSWSPAQYVLGGMPVLPEEYGPQGLNAFNLQFDYAAVVVPGPFVTQNGTNVDLSGIEEVALPDLAFLASIAGPRRRTVLTAAGYGIGEALNRPGEGGNRGGAVNDLSTLGVRLTTTGTLLMNFMGQHQNLAFGSQNPARDFSGTCSGDSGGPMFYVDQGLELQVAITSSGDSICRGSAIMARVDIPEAQDFLSCVLDGATLDDITACGCTKVNARGVCPDKK